MLIMLGAPSDPFFLSAEQKGVCQHPTSSRKKLYTSSMSIILRKPLIIKTKKNERKKKHFEIFSMNLVRGHNLQFSILLYFLICFYFKKLYVST